MHTEEKKRPHGAEAYLTNKIGHATGRGIAKALWRKNWFRAIAAQHPGMMKLASEGLIALTSLLELGGDHPVVRLANFVTETLAMENLELLEEFEKNPDDSELAKKVSEKIDAAIDKTEKDVVIAFDHIHKDAKCVPVATLIAATTTTRAGKDGKTFTSPSPVQLVMTDMSSALAAGRPLCGICYRATSVRKPEDPQKPSEIVPGRNFLEYVMRLKSEDKEAYEGFWKSYLIRMEDPDGPELARKFQEAFNGKHSYEAFRFVVDLPHRRPETDEEEWHVALDSLLGKVTPPESWKKSIGGFIDEEKRQTEEMFRSLFGHIRKFADGRKVANAKLDEELKSLREARKVRAAQRRNGKLVNRIVIVSLSVLGIAAYVLTHAN